MKIIWKGNVFNPTGISTANREMAKALEKLGCEIQTTDIWTERFDCAKGLEHWNTAIKPDKETVTVFADYPQFWRDGYGKIVGHFLHEGTRLFPEWSGHLNQVEKLWVPSEATRNLFKWNDVTTPIEVIPYGTKPEIYKPKETDEEKDFVFLSVNSWTGEFPDRKGTGLLIKAFDEEFAQDEKVKLVLKIGTFWAKNLDYMAGIFNIIGKPNPNIVFNDSYVSEEDLASYYQMSDCFVAPTMGESFGLTILNAMACGLPVIVTKDVNSGHMDFCKGKDSVLWIDAPSVVQGDPKFFVKGNMQAAPTLESLKKQLRTAFNNRKELKAKGLKNSEQIREKYTWDNTAKKIMEFLK